MVKQKTIKKTTKVINKKLSPPKDADLREYQLFLSLDIKQQGRICPWELKNLLIRQGLLEDDFRLKECFDLLNSYKKSDKISYQRFCEIIRPNILLIEQALQGNMVIPNFGDFTNEIRNIYNTTKKNDHGQVANYIPELSRVHPDHFAVAVCTIDGQKFAVGDADKNFSIQSICKTVSYCLALEEHGEQNVHRHVGREPSGSRFNEITFNDKGLPHNPMINAGAVMTCALIRPDLKIEDRLQHIMNTWSRLAGDQKVYFNESVYLSESKTGHRNRALGWLMLENDAFPKGVNLNEVLELYFQSCSIETSAQMMAAVAATFANGGICPVNGERIFSAKTVQHCLSLMFSCGMYDFSGEHTFTIGLPTKSGVGGGMMIVVPNLMGICTWSPRIDQLGNSVRGIEFCKRLVEKFNIHHYDNLTGVSQKKNPRLDRIQTKSQKIDELIWAASKGDLGAIQRLEVRGIDLNGMDYDKRTPLHLAAAEGRKNIVEYLIKREVNINVQDRWGGTPLDDAIHHNHEEIVALLKKNKALHKGEYIINLQNENERELFSEDIVRVIWAVSMGDMSSLQNMIAKGKSLRGADYDMRTPLHLAACEGHIAIAELLISHGVNINAQDRWGNTPLDDAHNHQQKSIITLLRKNNAVRSQVLS
ncbi:glutaminase A [Candidatus Uabimicrobium amorphum]|uniref:Glutaminase n=1 Tax=Uabimicrobium amorphum TaxID=2596890 RepID=A0A5S9F286_UABAM|nr:glutaminase A [Candidatus Uabimicrobium amorphum]BBM81852.1 glutaminase [Candidatus Uabimicrobium amorphum]